MDIPLNLSPSIIFAGLSYLLVFRLAVIFLGGLSIYLGYRLFTQPLPRRKGGDEASELEAKFGNNELTLRSVAPGLFFLAFGALVVVVVLAGNAPEFKIHTETDKKGHVKSVAEVRSMLPATHKEAEDTLWERHKDLTELAGHMLKLAPGPRKKAEALAVSASLAFIGGDVRRAIELQTQALAELPENEVLQRRLAAYQEAL